MLFPKTSPKAYVCLAITLLIALASTILLHSSPQSQAANDTANIPSFSTGAPSAPVMPAKDTAGLIRAYGELPLSFEANQGQTDAQVQFVSRGGGYSLFLTSTEAVLALHKAPRESKPGIKPERGERPQIEKSDVVRMKLADANPSPRVIGVDELPGKSNYFIGNDPKKWRTDVPNYAKVKYANVYPGVDLVYYGNQGKLEYDFVVQPGADPHSIQLAVISDGQIGSRQKAVGSEVPLHIDGNGDLVVSTDGGQVIFHKPVIYQPATDRGQRSTDVVGGGYVLKGDRVTFELASYDKTKPLVIDPTLAYSTYLGGSVDDWGAGIAVDASGNAYVTGGTYSSDFPTTTGAFQTTNPGDVPSTFVTKLNATGSALLYSTYLGGSQPPFGCPTCGSIPGGIAVDASGDAYVAGTTSSSDFPTTPGALETTFEGNSCPNGYPCTDAFVTKLNASGSALVYSTYLGGSASHLDQGLGVAVDASGSAYVIGGAASDFPVTPGAFEATCGEGGGFFVSKLNGAGAALLYATYLCGVYGSAIAVDASGHAYVTGGAFAGFSTTPGAFQTTDRGPSDAYPSNAFVTKFNTTGSALDYSTYLGGSGVRNSQGAQESIGDSASTIAVDISGNAYVTGTAVSCDFPTTPGAFQAYLPSGLCAPQFTGNAPSWAFVTKLNTKGSALVYSTYLGGVGPDDYLAGTGGVGIAIAASGNSYVTGGTSAFDFPITPDAFETTGSYFVTKMNGGGSGLVYSTYFDGTGRISVDASGNAYITGGAFAGFPTTPGAFQTTIRAHGGNTNAFVSKFSFGLFALSPTSGHVGATAYILGNNLTGTTSVSFDGVAAKFSVLSSSKIRAIVPTGASTGTVSVVTPEGTLESSLPFQVIPQTRGFTPTSGPAGMLVTISGIAFTQTMAVTFGGVKATSFTVVSDTEVQATVPAGAKTGHIAITTAGGTVTTCNTFTVTQ